MHAPPRIDTVLRPLRNFLHTEASGGIVLMAATVIALIWANSPWSGAYVDLWNTTLTVDLGGYQLSKQLSHWINDGLMAIFFFVVGLEIKREVLVGELASARQAALPIAAAIGGAAVPAAIYVALASGSSDVRGWGVPMATDIAFVLGILALLGSRVPLGLKVFLTALAIVDDLIAVLVIALFYTAEIAWWSLAGGIGLFALLVLANRAGISRPLVYGIIGLVMWVAFVQSGVHATIAGVLLAMTIPARTRIDPRAFLATGEAALATLRHATAGGDAFLTTNEQQAALQELESTTAGIQSPLQRLEHTLHPWVAFVIVPLFALANAGVAFGADITEVATSSVSLGIIVGLLLGKQLGITLATALVVRSGLATLPDGVSMRHVYAASCLAGIGFTMSLFIADLAFLDDQQIAAAKIGILTASLFAALLGTAVLVAGGARGATPAARSRAGHGRRAPA